MILELDNPDSHECGDMLTIVQQVKRTVRRSGKFSESYGTLYEILGEAKVVHRYGDYIVATIRTSWAEIPRGAKVIPHTPAVVQMEVSVPEGDLQGRIIEYLAQRHYLIATRDTVFLNRGTDDGVIEGDTFYVINQSDDFLEKSKLERNLPPSVIGKVIVVHTESNSSVAVVTDATRALQVGDTVTKHVQ